MLLDVRSVVVQPVDVGLSLFDDPLDGASDDPRLLQRRCVDEQRRAIHGLSDLVGKICDYVESVGGRTEDDEVGPARKTGERLHEVIGWLDPVVPRHGERRPELFVVPVDRFGLRWRCIGCREVNESKLGMLVAGDVVGHLDLDRVVRTTGSEDRDLIDLVDLPVAEEDGVARQVFTEPPEVPADVARRPELLRQIGDEEVDAFSLDERVDHASTILVGVLLCCDLDPELTSVGAVFIGRDHASRSGIEVDDVDAPAGGYREAQREPKQRVLPARSRWPSDEHENVLPPARGDCRGGGLYQALVLAETKRVACRRLLHGP